MTAALFSADQAYVNTVWQCCLEGADLHQKLASYPNYLPTINVGDTNVTGWIALPIRNEFDELRGITFVDPSSPTKRVTLGAPEQNGDYLRITPMNINVTSEFTYVGDCHETAILIYRLTRRDVIVTATDNMAAIVRKLIENGSDPKKTIIFSHNKHIKNVELIAEQRGCGWIQTESVIGSVDYQKHNENLVKLLNNPFFTSPAREPLSYTAKNLENRPQLRWLVKGLISERSLNCIFGPSRSGKTFVSLGLAAAIATGKPWLNSKTKKRPVLYMPLESIDGFALRQRAYMAVHGTESLHGLHTWTQRFSFANCLDIEKLISHLNGGGFEGGIVIIDTLARAMSGLDENSAIDMGRVIEACSYITEKTGCAIMLIHHSGKNQQSGLRGHSALLGALDSAIEIRFSQTERKLYLDKTKEGSDGSEYPFKLNKVHLGFDEDGHAITSCYVEYTQLDTA